MFKFMNTLKLIHTLKLLKIQFLLRKFLKDTILPIVHAIYTHLGAKYTLTNITI
jgi:hypothetical protein